MNPTEPLLLVGLDGANPLAFLAALGTLRSLALAWPDRRVRMSWGRHPRDGPWRPAVHVDPPATPVDIVAALDAQLKRMRDHQAWSLGPDLSLSPETYRKDYALPAAQVARDSEDRTWADFVAAFGCEATVTDQGLIQDTALRTMSGAGHQHFLGFMHRIVGCTGPEHLEKALFRPWLYDDPVENLTLRWDPMDDVRRALRWRDPSGDPRRKRRGGMLGANRLAIEGLPLLPSIPVSGGELRTTGFSGRGGKTSWTWPIWSGPLSPGVIRSLLALKAIQRSPESPALRSMGIVEIYRSRRITRDKFRCFTPGQPI
jgi:hypothetical protein